MKNDNREILMPLLPRGGELHGNSGQFVRILAFHFVPRPVLRAQGCVEHILLGGRGVQCWPEVHV